MGISCSLESCAYKKDKGHCVLKNLAIDQDGKCAYYRAADFHDIQSIEHWNVYDYAYIRADGGRCTKGVYCRMLHKVMKSLDQCPCPLMSGVAQGHGIECYWDDVKMNTYGAGFWDPQAEYLRVSHLIKSGVLDRNPSRNGEYFSEDDYYKYKEQENDVEGLEVTSRPKEDENTPMEILSENYLDVDDDEMSILGAAILKDAFGMTVDELFDDEDT